MVKPVDLTGMRFGRLVALHRATGEDALYYTRWWCRCDCGSEKFVARSSLKTGETTSCGCLQSEAVKRRRTTHGLSRTPEYYCWKNMLSRCYDSTDVSYQNYGARGIQVCSEWLIFESFLASMGVRPDGHSIERIDNDGDYEKKNCRWATRDEQMANTRVNRLVTYKGQTKTITQWGKELGLSRGVLAYRLKHWKDLETVMTAPAHPGLTPTKSGDTP